MLLDLSMPQMDGLEALSRIREAAPNTMVVVYSGFIAERMAKTTSDLGAVTYIEKGVPPQELVRRMAELAGLDLSTPNGSAETILKQDAEKVRQHRSRIAPRSRET
ncbi:MAG: response regulator [Nitrospiraceae bacterium]|nr:response regulator [Nitrospiraceae bacterium]